MSLQKKKRSVLKFSQKIDALAEIGNIGSAHAANALAKMINERVDIETPDVEMLNVNEFAFQMSKYAEKLFICWNNVEGIVNASILTIFRANDVIKLISLIPKKEFQINIDEFKNFDDLSEPYKNVLIEIGDNLARNYVNSLGDLLGQEITPQPPRIKMELGSELTTILKEELGLDESLSLIIKTRFMIQKFNIEGSICFIPDHKKLKDLLRALSEYM
ncbi:MAG: hypothetical protein EAX96_10580 [Candidatus Lokiarchaeota archaeon]|nr:hypothetical protein [Candidatus Lokiarchaeota archaeon]